MRKACVFCGGGPLSREHVYPKWLRQHYGPVVNVRSVVQRPTGQTDKRPQVPFDITVRSVCVNCNNGWMSALEEAASQALPPLMHGQTAVLPMETARVVAGWAFKTILMIQEQASPEAGLIGLDDYRHLLDHRLPPSRVRLWMAEHGAGLTDAMAVAYSTLDHLVIRQSADPALPEGSTCWSAGIALGRLLIFGLGTAANAEVPEPEGALPWLRPLWPEPAGVLVWPPVRSADEFGGFWPCYKRLFPA